MTPQVIGDQFSPELLRICVVAVPGGRFDRGLSTAHRPKQRSAEDLRLATALGVSSDLTFQSARLDGELLPRHFSVGDSQCP